MKVKLIRHHFPDKPDWILINESVPLGTLYEVLDHAENCSVTNKITGESRPISLYLVDGNNDLGWLPTICFEEIVH